MIKSCNELFDVLKQIVNDYATEYGFDPAESEVTFRIDSGDRVYADIKFLDSDGTETECVFNNDDEFRRSTSALGN